MLNVACAQIEMPKIMNVEIKKVGFVWKISLRGVLLKRPFLTYESAMEHLPEVQSYFGDNCTFMMKEAA